MLSIGVPRKKKIARKRSFRNLTNQTKSHLVFEEDDPLPFRFPSIRPKLSTIYNFTMIIILTLCCRLLTGLVHK